MECAIYDVNNKKIQVGDFVQAKIWAGTAWETTIYGYIALEKSALVLKTEHGYAYLHELSELQKIKNKKL